MLQKLALGSVLAALVGCAAATPASTTPPATPADQHVIQVPPSVISPYSESDLAHEFDKARTLLLADKYAEAAPLFDKIVRMSPNGLTAAPSLFNGGLAKEGLNERAAALASYADLLARFPDHDLAREAVRRSARLDAYLEKWDDLASAGAKILAQKGLTVLEAIEGHGARALGLIEQDKIDEAAGEIAQARDLIEQNRIGEATKPPIELAEVAFALGELRRKKSEKITFVPVPPNFGDALEQRCTGLLDAQSAYTDAMRSMDAHWSAMAGYRVGQLYQQLHRDVMLVPPPEKAGSLKQKQLFEGAMRLRYRVLLEKGLKMMEGTVKIGERTGEDSTWISRARDAKKDIELAIGEEKTAMSKLPFTEEELQTALDSLKKKP